MSELRDLYQEVILDHVKRPRNSGALAGASHRADGDNPLCGDKVTIFLSIEEGRIADVRFQGRGCAISLASASLMTEAIIARTSSTVSSVFSYAARSLTRAPSVPSP